MLQQKSKNATVIVTGCLTKINPESMNKLKDIIVINFDKLEQLDTMIHSTIPFKQIPYAGTIGSIPPLYSDKIIRTILDSRINPHFFRNIPEYLNKIKDLYFKKINEIDAKEIYHIRISRGCLGNCTYCSIKFAHGRLQSRPLEQIQKDFETGLKKGYKIFKLIGQDIGCYGIDIKTNILEVLTLFFKLPGKNKIIITDFHPRWFIQYYDQLESLFLAHHEKILSLRIPFESGSDTVLTRMRRQYKIEEVKKYITLLKEKIPTLKIYTHILVGFPGETDEDFQLTLNLVKEIHFNSIGIYSYSDRPMTESFKMKEKIPLEVIRERMRQIKNQARISN